MNKILQLFAIDYNGPGSLLQRPSSMTIQCLRSLSKGGGARTLSNRLRNDNRVRSFDFHHQNDELDLRIRQKNETTNECQGDKQGLVMFVDKKKDMLRKLLDWL
jgi:hypothetical protein